MKRYGKARARLMKQMQRFPPGDLAEVERFEAFLRDGLTMQAKDLAEKYHDYLDPERLLRGPELEERMKQWQQLR